jgi:hypothetical protein
MELLRGGSLADLYALGKELYPALTGGSARTIRPLPAARLGLPAEWSDFLFHLVEERPEDRYPSARAALEVLAYLATLPPAEEARAAALERDALSAAARAYERGYAAGRRRARRVAMLAAMAAAGAALVAVAWAKLDRSGALRFVMIALGAALAVLIPAIAAWVGRAQGRRD